jgi:hypothetical protein
MDSSDKSHDLAESQWLLLLLSLVVIMAALLALFLGQKHLSADGSHYLRLILDTGETTRAAWSRQFANDLTQWLVVLAVRSGLRDVFVLSHLYGLGLFILYPLLFLICALAVRGERPLLLIYPLLSIAGVNLPASAVLFGESHEMVLLTWPILFLAIRRAPLKAFEVAILWTLLLFFTRVYETSLPVSILFLLILIVRLARTGKLDSSLRSRTRLIWSVALILSAIGASIAAYFIFFPDNPDNKASFASSMGEMAGNPKAILAFVVTSCLSLLWVSGRPFYGMLALFSLGVSCLVMLRGGDYSSMGQSFSARGLSLLLLPLLVLWTLFVARYPHSSSGWLPVILFAYISVASFSEVATLPRWLGYLNDFRTVLTKNEGLVSLKESGLEGGYGGWAWTYPTMSVLLQAPCVRTIVLNDPSVTWQPFDPSQKLVLKDFVSYGPVLHRIDPTASLCD